MELVEFSAFEGFSGWKTVGLGGWGLGSGCGVVISGAGSGFLLIAYERAARGWRVFGGWGIRVGNQSLYALPESGAGLAASFFCAGLGAFQGTGQGMLGDISVRGPKALNGRVPIGCGDPGPVLPLQWPAAERNRD